MQHHFFHKSNPKDYSYILTMHKITNTEHLKLVPITFLLILTIFKIYSWQINQLNIHEPNSKYELGVIHFNHEINSQQAAFIKAKAKSLKGVSNAIFNLDNGILLLSYCPQYQTFEYIKEQLLSVKTNTIHFTKKHPFH